jgi:hypothetical protein
LRILAAIAHFFDAEGDGYYGSTGKNAPERAEALARTIAALHQHFGKTQQKLLNRKMKIMTPANAGECYDVEVVVCTTEGKHLVASLPLPAGFFTHRETGAAPLMLGFECHEALRDGIGGYDFYCFLEDDLVIEDPWFFAKLRWFANQVGNDALLQPNRYELSVTEPIHKLYIDGHVSPDFAAAWQDVRDRPSLSATVMEKKVLFERPNNPHAGCFFLNKAQMESWASKPYFLDRDISFAGPLESAATLGIMKTFRIYKPAPASAGFLEIRHANARYLGNWLKL